MKKAKGTREDWIILLPVAGRRAPTWDPSIRYHGGLIFSKGQSTEYSRAYPSVLRTSNENTFQQQQKKIVNEILFFFFVRMKKKIQHLKYWEGPLHTVFLSSFFSGDSKLRTETHCRYFIFFLNLFGSRNINLINIKLRTRIFTAHFLLSTTL